MTAAEALKQAGFIGLRGGRPVDQLAIARDLEREQLRPRRQRHGPLRIGIHGVFAMLLVPLRDARVVVHVFHDLPPAHAGVVRAE